MKRSLIFAALLAFAGPAFAQSLVTTPPTGSTIDLNTTSPLNVAISATDLQTWIGTDLTITGGAFNGTVGATTPSTAVITTATINTSVVPDANDGAVLGSATVSWSDLFLASGGVINWVNGDVTVTHSANALAFAGASSGYSFAGPTIISEASSSALIVGPTGVSNPGLQVDTGAGSSATGIKITTAAAAGGVAVAAISSGADEALTINAKGTGTIGIGSVSTGVVTITPATTVTGVLTPTGGVVAAGGFSASPRNIASCGVPPVASTSGTDAVPVATETYNVEVFVPANMTVTGVAIMNGSVAADNMTVGLASSAGAPIAAAKSATTALSGTDALQRVPFASPYAAVGPATYFIQFQMDGTTGRYNAHPFGNCGVLVQTAQTYGVFASFTAPTTFVADEGPMAFLY